MKASELADLGYGAASLMMEKAGEIHGMILMHASNAIVAIPYKNCKPEEVNTQRMVIIETVRIAREAGVFEGLVLMSEAWVATQTENLAGVLRPAIDPDRKEIILVHAYGDDGKSLMITADIIRDGDKVSLGRREDVKYDVECWLDAAFK